MARIAGSTPRSTSTIHQRPARTASAFGRTAKNVHSLRARRRSSIAMARCYHWWHNGPAGRPPMNVNRRFALRTLAQFAIAVPLARRGFAAPADVEIQPLLAHVRRIFDAMRYLGEPFSDADLARFAAIEDAK